MSASPDRYTIAVDFDGVIHRYDSPWVAPHVIPDEPVDGAIEWLHTMIQRFDVVIFSTRASTKRGSRAMRAWLMQHAGSLWSDSPGSSGLINLRFHGKPPALIYLDDRSVRFEGPGTFPTADQIHRAKPWHKKDNGA